MEAIKKPKQQKFLLTKADVATAAAECPTCQ